MTGMERWPYDEMRRLESEERLAEGSSDDPLFEGHMTPGPMARPPVVLQRPGTGHDNGRSDPLAQADPASIPRASWRSEIKGASGVNLVAGVWLAVSPFVLAYRPADPVWTQVAFGGAIALLALVRVTSGVWKSWMSWANASFGAGLCLVAVLAADSAPGRWNGIVTGALVLVLAALSASATESATSRPRGTSPP